MSAHLGTSLSLLMQWAKSYPTLNNSESLRANLIEVSKSFIECFIKVHHELILTFVEFRMAWTWTGYDHDAVHRFKDEKFWQTGRNKAEDRFWQTQIHGDGDYADRWVISGHKLFIYDLLLSGEAPCHPSLLDQEPVPSGVDTQTVRADMFMASSEINRGIHHHV